MAVQQRDRTAPQVRKNNLIGENWAEQSMSFSKTNYEDVLKGNESSFKGEETFSLSCLN